MTNPCIKCVSHSEHAGKHLCFNPLLMRDPEKGNLMPMSCILARLNPRGCGPAGRDFRLALR